MFTNILIKLSMVASMLLVLFIGKLTSTKLDEAYAGKIIIIHRKNRANVVIGKYVKTVIRSNIPSIVVEDLVSNCLVIYSITKHTDINNEWNDVFILDRERLIYFYDNIFLKVSTDETLLNRDEILDKLQDTYLYDLVSEVRVLRLTNSNIDSKYMKVVCDGCGIVFDRLISTVNKSTRRKRKMYHNEECFKTNKVR